MDLRMIVLRIVRLPPRAIVPVKRKGSSYNGEIVGGTGEVSYLTSISDCLASEELTRSSGR